MIWESRHWKTHIRDYAAALERWSETPDLIEDAHALRELEEAASLAFYLTRQLFETRSLREETRSMETTLSRHALIAAQAPDHETDAPLGELYDLESQKTERLSLRRVCNQFIHYALFVTSHGEDGSLDGIYFASDFMKKEGLYFIEAASLVALLRAVGLDDAEVIRRGRVPAASALASARKSPRKPRGNNIMRGRLSARWRRPLVMTSDRSPTLA